LFGAARSALAKWTDNLRAEAGGRLPKEVMAFRSGSWFMVDMENLASGKGPEVCA
jgi:hypothetical protein